MRKNNVLNMTISEQIEAIKAEICKDYCKHLERLELDLEADEAQQILEDDYCSDCPLVRL